MLMKSQSYSSLGVPNVPYEVIVAVGAPDEARTARAIQAQEGIDIVRRCADLAEAVAAVQAGIGHVAVVGTSAHLDRAVVATFAAAHTPLIVLCGDKEVAAMTALGVRATSSPTEAAVLAHALAEDVPQAPPEALSDIPEPPREGRGGRVIAVTGPVGAPGRTTAVMEMAHALGVVEEPALMVDLDTYGSSLASRLGVVDDIPGVIALARAGLSGEVSVENVQTYIRPVTSGCGLVTGLPRPSRWPEVVEAGMDAVWDSCRRAAATVVVDCGPGIAIGGNPGGRDGGALSALRAADHVVVVGAGDPIGIQRLVQFLADMEETIPALPPRTIVVNRVRSQVAGPRPREAVADALARHAGVEEVWTVADAPALADAALMSARAMAEQKPGSDVARSWAAIAKHVHQQSLTEVSP